MEDHLPDVWEQEQILMDHLFQATPVHGYSSKPLTESLTSQHAFIHAQLIWICELCTPVILHHSGPDVIIDHPRILRVQVLSASVLACEP